MKERLDVLLVKRNLAESREKAKALIMSGIVYVNGQKPEVSVVEQLFLFFNVCDSGSRHHGAQSVHQAGGEASCRGPQYGYRSHVVN